MHGNQPRRRSRASYEPSKKLKHKEEKRKDMNRRHPAPKDSVKPRVDARLTRPVSIYARRRTSFDRRTDAEQFLIRNQRGIESIGDDRFTLPGTSFETHYINGHRRSRLIFDDHSA
jgi:hypothetical protein